MVVENKMPQQRMHIKNAAAEYSGYENLTPLTPTERQSCLTEFKGVFFTLENLLEVKKTLGAFSCSTAPKNCIPEPPFPAAALQREP